MSPRWHGTRSSNPVLRGGANDLFAGRHPQVREVYERLTSALRSVGPFTVEPKRTSIHLLAEFNGSAFAGVHPRKAALLLNIRSRAPLGSPRVRKVEQVSKNRFHNELLLESPDDVNAELIRWLRVAYGLASGRE